MSEEAKQLPAVSQTFDNRMIVTVFISTLIAELMRGWLPFLAGLCLAYFFVFVIGYWIGRKPDVPFGRFVFRLTAYLAIIVAGFWAIPELLSRLVWRPVAYAVPLFLAGLTCYWLPPLYPLKRKQARLSVWLLCCFVVACLYGWAMKFTD